MKFTRVICGMSGVAIALSGVFAVAGGKPNAPKACSATTQALDSACRLEVADDLLVASAVCLNVANAQERRLCERSAQRNARDAFRECREVAEARDEVCDAVGEARYDPPFGEAFADQFVDPRDIGGAVAPNRYFPIVPGSERAYEKTFVDDEGEEVVETVRIKVTGDTKLIDGITCLVVNDTVEVDGEMIEDTDDWFAQDVAGNVWYCGEIAKNFEFSDGDDPEVAELVDIDGSWKAGRDGALPGILIPAAPVVGQVIRQEVSWTNAEDVIEILSLRGVGSAPAATCDDQCLVTRDFSALSPGGEEHKYYAVGVGLILEVDPESGERLELIEIIDP